MNRLSIILAVIALVLALPWGRDAGAEIRTSHFRFVPDSGSVGVAEQLAKTAESERGYVLNLLGTRDDRVIEVRIASNEESMMQMVGTRRPVRDWVAGLALSSRDLVVLSARGNEVFKVADTFVHELAHIYLRTALDGRSVPRWFNEGFAMLVASEQVGERLKTAMGAAATGSYIPLERLVDSFPVDPPTVHLAYAQSMLFVRYLHHHGGRDAIPSLLTEVRAGMPFDLAFNRVFDGSVSAWWDRFEDTLDPASALLWILSSTAVLWVLVTLLFLYAYLVKRRRVALKRQAWAIQEEIDRVREQARKRGIDPYEVQ